MGNQFGYLYGRRAHNKEKISVNEDGCKTNGTQASMNHEDEPKLNGTQSLQNHVDAPQELSNTQTCDEHGDTSKLDDSHATEDLFGTPKVNHDDALKMVDVQASKEDEKLDDTQSSEKDDSFGFVKAMFGRNVHLLRFWNELSPNERESLTEQMASIDIDDMEKCFENSDSQKEVVMDSIEGIDDDHSAVACNLDDETRNYFWRKGLEAVAEGKVAAIVLAGGQASRLGANRPKGTLSLGFKGEPMDANDGFSLLGLQAAQIARLQHLARSEFPGSNAVIQWVIMTSRYTELDTLEHLQMILPSYGLSMDQVTLFNQGEIPCFDFEGNFILAGKSQIAMAPDGNGGLYASLASHLNKLRDRGISYFHVYCVDNVLCRVADPHFIGFCISKDADCAAKAVAKAEPHEKVGVICREQGKIKVLEYSEIDSELAEKKDSLGRLVLRAGNIANHYFTIDFLDRICSECRLPYHRAIKKIPYMSEDGELVKPDEPNGIKLEQFIFDVFEYAQNFYVWEVSRESEFSPLKNPDSAGKECLTTCRQDISAECRRWLERAGANINGDQLVFINPIRSYNGEGLEEFNGSILETPFILDH